MTSRTRLHPPFGVLAALLAVSACADPTVPGDRLPSEARMGKGGGGAQLEVTGASPAEAPPGYTFDVRVTGSGFDSKSNARWLRSDGLPSQVLVNSTVFVSESELIANVTVEAEAEDAVYDIEVTALRGKKGLGAELFAVDRDASPPPGQADPVELVVSLPPLDTGYGLENDGGPYDELVDPDIDTHLSAANGNLYFNTRDGDTRRVGVDLPPFDSGMRATRIYTNDSDVDLRTEGDWTATSRLFVEWSGDESKHQLRFGVSCAGNAFEPEDEESEYYRGQDRVEVVKAGDTWTLTGSTAVLCIQPLRGKKTVTEEEVSAPFLITLVDNNR